MRQCDRDLGDITRPPKRRNWSEKDVSSLDPLFQALSVKNMQSRAMAGLAAQSGIDLRTFEGWRSHLEKYPGSRSYRSHNQRRVFDDGEEGSLANSLRVQIREKRYIVPLMVNLLAKHVKQLLQAGAEIRPDWGDEILNSR
jgi:hypothetical protein